MTALLRLPAAQRAAARRTHDLRSALEVLALHASVPPPSPERVRDEVVADVRRQVRLALNAAWGLEVPPTKAELRCSGPAATDGQVVRLAARRLLGRPLPDWRERRTVAL